jgi:hypothetical protein
MPLGASRIGAGSDGNGVRDRIDPIFSAPPTSPATSWKYTVVVGSISGSLKLTVGGVVPAATDWTEVVSVV